MREKPRAALWRHQDVREGIQRKSAEVLGDGEVSDESLETFFMLEGEKLTEQEKRDVELFRAHIGERLINAIMNRPGNAASSREEAMERLNKPGETFGLISFHDPAHCITTYERSETNSVVPGFFRHSFEEAFLTPEVIAEEFPALLWSRPVENMNLFTSLLERESANQLFDVLRRRAQGSSNPERFLPEIETLAKGLDPTSFASVRRTFEEYTMLFLRTSSPQNISPDLLARAEPVFREVVERSQREPDEQYLAFAKRLFNEYKTNKRIYIEEFERILAPLLRRLRQKNNSGT